METIILSSESYSIQQFYIAQIPELKRLLQNTSDTVEIDIDASGTIKNFRHKPFQSFQRSQDEKPQKVKFKIEKLNF